jgi:hypothetical protein
LGPVALGLALLSWVIPVVGLGVAALAVVLGVVSVATRGEYRIDWTAAAGICVGLGQGFFTLVLWVMSLTGM